MCEDMGPYHNARTESGPDNSGEEKSAASGCSLIVNYGSVH